MTTDGATRRRPGRVALPVRRLGRAVGFTAVFSLPVAVLALLLRSPGSPIVAFDHAVIREATDLTRADPQLRGALLAWQEVFKARWFNLAGALLCLWVWRRRGLGARALWAVVTLLVTWNLGLDVKYLVRRARPVVEDAVSTAPGYSFPSGHAANTAAAGLTLVVLVWPLLGPRGRVVVPALAGAAILLTGADRVLLGVHYPSDVVGGIILGAAMVAGSYLGYVGWEPADAPAPGAAPRPTLED